MLTKMSKVKYEIFLKELFYPSMYSENSEEQNLLRISKYFRMLETVNEKQKI